jgi:hypothetical protein
MPDSVDGEMIAIAADHVNMIKFASREDESYGNVSGHLQAMAERASRAICARWDEQDRIEDGKLSILI